MVSSLFAADSPRRRTTRCRDHLGRVSRRRTRTASAWRLFRTRTWSEGLSWNTALTAVLVLAGLIGGLVVTDPTRRRTASDRHRRAPLGGGSPGRCDRC